jgi:TatD DNase family protein
VKALPPDGFVLETDSPDMPLDGFHGERNEPANVARVGARIAALRDVSPSTITTQSTANARALFSLPL